MMFLSEQLVWRQLYVTPTQEPESHGNYFLVLREINIVTTAD